MRMAEGRVVNSALMDYVLLPKQMRGRLLDVNVCRQLVEEYLAILVETQLKVVADGEVEGGWRAYEMC